jgi:hypothetical protein
MAMLRTAVCPECKVEAAIPDEWPEDEAVVLSMLAEECEGDHAD